MALAHSREYNFHHYLRAHNGTASSFNIARNHVWQTKEGFVAGGWTVMGSHDGRGAFSNDGTTSGPFAAGTDHWTGVNIVYSSGSSRKWWVVLQCPPEMGVMQICIADNYGISNQNYWNLWTSNAGQFMTANGGVDGTSTAPPTAPDAFQHMTTIRPIKDGATDTIELHAAFSTDKTQIFLFSTYRESLTLFMAFCKLDNAPAELDDGMVWFCEAENSVVGADPDATKMDNADHYTSAQWIGSVSGVLRSMYLGGRGFANVGIQSITRVPDDGKLQVGPCELYISTAGVQGYYGTIPDMYWTANNHFNTGFGDTVGGPINWYCGGSLLIPWDFEQALPRRY